MVSEVNLELVEARRLCHSVVHYLAVWVRTKTLEEGRTDRDQAIHEDLVLVTSELVKHLVVAKLLDLVCADAAELPTAKLADAEGKENSVELWLMM